ncbi:MAG TPA: ABC transporter family substrate-binding protein, partial [Kribbella sp.]
MRTGKRLAAVAAVAGTSLLVATACTGGSGDPAGDTAAGFTACADKPTTCNSGSTRKGGTLTYAIEKTITNWNVNDTDGNGLDFGYIARTMLPQAFTPQPDLKPVMNTDLLESAEQTSADPQTIVYKIQSKATWDDGTPVSADDFVYAWQTQNGRDCLDCAAANSSGYNQMQSVTGSDDGRTVTVVYGTPFTDWQQKFASMYPAHVARQHGDLAASWKWFTENRINFSAGPFKLAEYNKDVSVTLVPNDRWYGKDRSPLSKLIFRIITDQDQEIPALRNNEVQVVYPQPSRDIIDQVKQIPDVNYTIGHGLQWEHLDLNLKNKFLADRNLRQAIFTATDRDEIISRTVGQFDPSVKPLNSHNLTPGAEGYKDVVTPTGAGTGNVDAAKKVLTDAGYKDVGTELKTPAGEPVRLRIA